MNLTDNEIKKALECCTKGNTSDVCVDCPLRTTDICTEEENGVLKLALDYINRLETENKALNRDNNRLLEEIQDVKESERKTAKKYHAKLIDAYKKLKTARTEAVKEFAERLKGLSFQTYKGCFAYEITEENLNNLLKEMVGDAE